MKVCLIKKGTLGGAEYLESAYLHEDACKLICKEMEEEWADFKPVKKEGEEIAGNRIIIDDKIYQLNREDKTSVLTKLAMKKLKPEEIKALKKTFSLQSK